MDNIDKKSVFHGGFFYLQRIDEILKALDTVTSLRHTDQNPIKRWRENYSLLNCLFKEIYPKMKAEEKKEHKEAVTTVKQELEQAIKDFKSKGKTNDKFFLYFDEWELCLRDIAEARGLNMPDKSDITEATDL